MLERDDGLVKPPARSTIGEILKRNGLAGRGRRRPRHVHGPPSELTAPGRPNHVRAADCKGWFLLGDGRRCIPLTITDLHSRFVILLSADEVSTQAAARRGFERAFREFGLPEAIRVEFIRRGKPQDNGSHERMHRILKAECCELAKADHRAQQRRFDQWREEFNGSRPHEALGMRTPSEACRRSGVAYDGRTRARLYEPGDEPLRVSVSGSVSLDGHALHVGEALQGAQVALERLESGAVAVRYANVRLGEFLPEAGDGRASGSGNPFQISEAPSSQSRNVPPSDPVLRLRAGARAGRGNSQQRPSRPRAGERHR